MKFSAPYTDSNESAASLAWLSDRLVLAGDRARSLTQQRWHQCRKEMLGVSQVLMDHQNWISDYWVSRSTQTVAGFLAPKWAPPDRIDQWPTLGGRETFQLGARKP